MVGNASGGVVLALFIRLALTAAQSTFLEVEEERNPNTFVGRVDGANDDYTLTSTPYFELINGELFTKTKIDREALTNDVIRLTAVSGRSGQAPIEISVTVTDINDHDPYFPRSPLDLSLTEESGGNKYILPLAEDADSGQNADITSYQLVEGDSALFQVSLESTLERSVLYLKVLQPLNREVTGRYELNISAADGGVSPRQGYLRVVVHVVDINDNAPIFEKAEVTETFPEDTPVGTALVAVHANDADLGANGRVTYSITYQPIPGTFAVNSTSGQINLARPLDYETRTSHRLHVKATDGGGGSGSMSDVAYVTINVRNVNDNDPEISFVYVPHDATIASVGEGVKVGATVAFVTVTDPDRSPISGDVSMDVVAGNELGHFELVKLGPSFALLKVANNDSLGDEPSYSLTIRVNDPDPDSDRFSLASLTVLVNSGDNSPPKFDMAHYDVTIPDDITVGSVVTSVHATDRDAGLNGRLAYSIASGNDLGWFNIDRTSGLVLTAEKLRFEPSNSNVSVFLRITVKDETTEPLSDSATLRIAISDVNNNSPLFSKPNYAFDIRENKAGLAGKIAASDADFGRNAEVAYNIEDVRTAAGDAVSNSRFFFAVSADGSVHVLQGLNREYTASYSLVISATDNGEIPLTSYAGVTINIADVNDNAPTFYPKFYPVTIRPDTPLKTVIATVMATDRDSLDTGSVTYHLASASTAQYYAINAKTGEVSLARSLPSRNAVHALTAFAKDGGEIVSTHNATLRIVVTTTPPSGAFDREIYDFYLLENSDNGYSIAAMKISTPNSVKFHITDGNEDQTFQIDVDTGVIAVANSTLNDADKSSLRNLTIVTELLDTSSSDTLGFATTSCYIHAVDVNDNFPEFQGLPRTVERKSPHGFFDTVRAEIGRKFIKKLIYDAHASDGDSSSKNNVVSYRLTSCYPYIEIDITSGVVYVKPLTTSSSNVLNFAAEISACDSGSPILCSTLTLDVTLIFVDGALNVPLTNTYAVLSEGSLLNNQIVTLPALQNFALEDVAGKVAYSVVPDTYFEAYPGGEVLLRENLDYETATGYEAVVILKTTLESGQAWESRAALSVSVQDANDNQPKAAIDEFRFFVQENAKPGDIVGSVQATDDDSGIFGFLVYAIQPQDHTDTGIPVSALFYCDRFTGNIYVAHFLSREYIDPLELVNGEMTLRIVVSDQGGVNSSGSAVATTHISVKIGIEFENRHKLAFQKRFYSAEVLENSFWPDILTVKAQDEDVVYAQAPDIKYRIRPPAVGNATLPFTIGETSGVVGLKKERALNREHQDSYHLTLEATYSDYSETATANLNIRVLDVKDSPPVFPNESYTFSVPEDCPVLAPVGRVEARDGDSTTESTRIRYEVSSRGRSHFNIDSKTGFLFLVNTLDFEDQGEYNLSVTATDETGTSSSVRVLIYVRDVNDNSPVFVKASSSRIKEGYYSLPTTISTVHADDADGGGLARVTYSLLSTTLSDRGRSAVHPDIKVDPVTGRVTVIGTLDREDQNEIKYTVRASDGYPTSSMTSRRFSDVTLILELVDANDNPPVFTSPPSYVLSPQSTAQAGLRMMMITAKDADEGRNGEVAIAVAEKEENSDKFYIDGEGYLTLSSPLSRERIVYPVHLIAEDKGTPPKSTRQTVHIILSDDTISRSANVLPEISFPETSPDGSFVTNVAKGTARSSSSNVRFYITETTASDGGDAGGEFKINPVTGDITSASVSGKGGTDFVLDIVSVEEQKSKVSRSSVAIKVSDENDNAPLFAGDTQRIAVSESIDPRSKIATVKATDADTGDEVRYSLRSKSGGAVEDFTIDPKTAVISVGAYGLDRERRMEYDLEITADDGIHRTTTELLIDIEDDDDNPPKFPTSPMCFDLLENSPPGTFVGRVEAEDADSNANVEYSISNEDDVYSDMFKIHPAYGTVTFEGNSSSIDRESKDLYVVRIRATDEGGLVSEGRIFIHIADANDHPPTFDSKQSVGIGISEDTPVGSVIYRAKANDKDIGRNAEIFYSISSGDANQQFRIDSRTGDIRTTSVFDREMKPQYNLTVMATNEFADDGPRQIATMNVVIDLVDENDNPPSFALPLVVYLMEDAQVGDTVMEVNSFDPDFELSGIVRLSLTGQLPDHGVFRLDKDSRTIKIADVTNLDFETTKEYNLTVTGRDRGQPVLITTTHILVRIVDANDHSPEFAKTTYAIAAVESSAIGSHLVKVQTNDVDSGYNGDVRYSVVPSENSSYFYIDEFGGDLFLANFIDHESQKEISVEIEAADRGAESRRAFVPVVLAVGDENDNLPVVTPDFSIAHVRENTLDLLLRFHATDKDSGVNGIARIRSSLTVEPESDAFRIMADSDGFGTLTLRSLLDREASRTYTVTITAADQGSPPKKGTASLLVIVDDSNDNVPEFQQFGYFAEVSEDAPPGSLVAAVKATDLDGTSVTYELDTRNISSPFYVHPTSGEIFTRGYLNREQSASYDLTIFARDEKDSEGVQNTVSVSLAVTITDVNDNEPRFGNERFEIFVDSANSAGTVFIAEAIDPDEGVNGRLTYTMSDNPLFQIDGQTGQVEATVALNSGHTLTIHATDHGVIPSTASVVLNIFLASHRKPTLTSDVSSSVQLTENVPLDTLVGTFTATSSRAGARPIRFYLKGDRYGWFKIDQDGRLKVAGNIDREIADSLTLWIEARDSGRPELSAFEKIAIRVEDTNDNGPRFENKVFSAHVKEDETRVLIQLSASDADQGENGEVTFSIVNRLSENPEKFKINSATGQISNLEVLNREEQSNYKLVVRATDGGSPALYRDVIVYVIVNDINDRPSTFTGLFQATVKEDAAQGDFVLRVTANDVDEICNRSYQLTDDSNGHFEIDRFGVITVAKPLDRETEETHQLRVWSSDGRWPIDTSVTIRVEDVNDNAPRFSASSRTVSVAVDAAVGTEVLRLNASDEDSGKNGKISYRISGGSEHFSISQMGRITTSRKLECPTHVRGCSVQNALSVVACDSGWPDIKCSACHVTVGVKSVNLHSPKFASSNGRLALLRTVASGTKLHTLSAIDEDAGSVLSYAITPESNATAYFTVSPSNEIILSRSVASFSTGQTLQIEVEASDDGVPPKAATARLTFEIAGQNDNSPEFVKPSYEVSPVSEDSAIGSEVVTVEARDDDAGINGKVTYEIFRGNEEGKFAVASTTGIISVADKLDFERTKEYLIVVKASDCGMVPRSVVANVRIPVQDVNDNVPMFNTSVFDLRIFETAAVGSKISIITARDDDTGVNAAVRYSLDDATTVSVGAVTGEVYLNSELDYEGQRLHVTKIFAVNDGADGKSEAEILLTVLGSNEFAPKFAKEIFEFNIPHMAGKGTKVGLVAATDDDIGMDGVVEYLLVPAPGIANFRLDKNSGDITVWDGFVYSVGDVINFTVVAKNPTTSSESCMLDQTTLRISVMSNECHSDPCKNNATCVDGLQSVSCICVPGYTGKYCDVDVDDCVSSPCDRGACRDEVNGYRCSCYPGFTGTDCDVRIDYCKDAPCENGGKCLNGFVNFTCDCSFGTKGELCGIQSLDFPPQSFAVMDGFLERLSFEFSTVLPNALLLYSGLESAPYVILEILSGKLQAIIRPEENGELIVLNLNSIVSDGFWHSVTVTNLGLDFIVIVDECVSLEENNCRAVGNLPKALDFSTKDITIGGVQDTNVIRTGKVSSHDFVGCIRSLSFDAKDVTISTSSFLRRKHLVGNGCAKNTEAGACSAIRCRNGATCSDMWSHSRCDCGAGWQGRLCSDKLTGQAFAGDAFVTIAFTETFTRDAILEEISSPSRRRRSAGLEASSIEIRFRTRENEARLLAIVGQDATKFATLFIKSGKLRYQHMGADGLVELEFPWVMSDYEWHTANVEITRVDGVTDDVKMTLDSEKVQKSIVRGSNVIDEFNNPLLVKNIFIGGVPKTASAALIPVQNYKGCLSHFKLNGELHQMNPDILNPDIAVSVEGSGVVESCNGTGLTCDVEVCKTGQVCVPDDITVSKCVCIDGYVESKSGCAIPATAGISWWIVLIIVIFALLLVGGVLASVICFRRRQSRKRASEATAKRNGSADTAYEFQARAKQVTPDLLPDDVCIVTDDVGRQPVEYQNGSNIFSSQVALVPLRNATESSHRYTTPRLYKEVSNATEDALKSGRKSANDLLINDTYTLAVKRPASAQAKIAPVPSPLTVPDRGDNISTTGRENGNFDISHSKTMPRKTANRALEYATELSRDTTKRPISWGMAYSGSRSSGRMKNRLKRKSREAETLDIMMRELSGIAGLTKEEMDLLQAGALALGHHPADVLFDDTSSTSTSSVTDMSIQSRTTSSSLRVRSFVRSTTPQTGSVVSRDTVPNATKQTLPRPSSLDLADRQANLGPFEFPSPPSDSDESSSDDETTWDSATSNETAISTVKKVYSSGNSSSGSGFQSNYDLDLIFPSNLEEYFGSLADVFDDISCLKSDKTKGKLISDDDPQRRPSVLPGFVSNEISLWSEIEALSRRPLRRPTRIPHSIDSGTRSPSGGSHSSEGRATPTRKTGSRMSSPFVHEVIKEEQAEGEDVTSQPRDQKSPTLSEGIDSVSEGKSRRNASRSSSGRSAKSLKMKTEFVKYV